MTLKEYYNTITKNPEQILHLNTICKHAARGYLLSSLAAVDVPAETVAEVIGAFDSISAEISFVDAAKVSKQITNTELKQSGILVP